MSRESSSTKRRLVLAVVGLVLAGAAIIAGFWVSYRFSHSISNDAFVDSHLINVSPQVKGDIVAVFIQEQDRVKRGQLLIQVDPAPYQREVNKATARRDVARAALEKAQADLALLEGEVPRRIAIAEAKLDIARDTLTQANDALDRIKIDVEKGIDAASQSILAAQAAYTLASEDFTRYGNLYKDGSVSERRFQEATKIFETAKADVEIARARHAQAEAERKREAIARQQVDASKHAIREADSAVALARLGNLQIAAARKLVDERSQDVVEAERALEVTQLNLDYTRVKAPYDGVIAKKWRHLGDYAHTGEPILSMYNPDLLYVTVHLEETLLQGVSPGNAVRLDVDAYSEPFRGRVLWIGSATDANFSLIPRDVSSGEFTYVVQRVPTRIWIERDERWDLLRPGLSVTVTIEHGPGDPAWAREALRKQAEIADVQEP
ncbi:MAG: HlyD family secretion protein [Gemmataceae bacterium]